MALGAGVSGPVALRVDESPWGRSVREVRARGPSLDVRVEGLEDDLDGDFHAGQIPDEIIVQVVGRRLARVPVERRDDRAYVFLIFSNVWLNLGKL